jgi:hypothetical protein
MGPQPFGEWLYQAWGVPWRENDINARLKRMREAQYAPFLIAFFPRPRQPSLEWKHLFSYEGSGPDRHQRPEVY